MRGDVESSDSEDENTRLLPSQDGIQQPQPQHLQLRVNVLLLAIVFFYTFTMNLFEAPRTRLFENSFCYDFYSIHDPSRIGEDGIVDEKLCKIDPVQAQVATLKGWQGFLDYLPGLFLAIPYGALADKYGRKWLMVLNAVSLTCRYAWVYVVCSFPRVFPLHLVWLEAVLGIFGGGFVVTMALVYVMISDVTHQSFRANSFYRLHGFNLMTAVLAPPLASVLMERNHWIPVTLSIGIQAMTVPLSLALPETLQTAEQDRTTADDASANAIHTNDLEPSSPKISSPSIYSERGFAGVLRQRLKTLLVTVHANATFLTKDWHIPFFMGVFFFFMWINGLDILLIQYISKRYFLTLARGSLLYSLQAAVYMFTLLLILPALSTFLVKRKAYTGTAKDILLSRWSLSVLALGCLLVGLAPTVPTLIIGQFIAAFGIGALAMIRSLMTPYVQQNEVGKLYAVTSVMETAGVMIGFPVTAGLFEVGLKRGEGQGVWLGLPFMVIAGILAVVAALMWVLRLEGTEEKHRSGDGVVPVVIPVSGSLVAEDGVVDVEGEDRE